MLNAGRETVRWTKGMVIVVQSSHDLFVASISQQTTLVERAARPRIPYSHVMLSPCFISKISRRIKGTENGK
jgi:hypothetical protein